MYGENPNLPPDPYSQDYNDPLPPAGPPGGIGGDAPRGRSRTRSPPPRDRENGSYRSPYHRRSPAPLGSSGLPPSGLGSNGTVGPGTGGGGGGGPRRPAHAPILKAPNPSNVLGVFGLSIRTQERDLDEEFSRFGRVEKVTIVYDQRSDRSRGFGFIRMATVEDATRCIQELNGVDLNGRRIRVDYSVTDRPHAPTPGEYMGHRRATRDGNYPGSSGGSNSGRDRDRDRDRDRGDRDRDRDRDYYSSSRGGGDSYYKDREGGRDRRDRDRDYYGRDSRGDTRDWRERRSPPPPSRSGRYSPEYRRRRSYSRSPPRGSSPTRGGAVAAGREYDAAPPPPVVDARW